MVGLHYVEFIDAHTTHDDDDGTTFSFTTSFYKPQQAAACIYLG